VEEGKKYMQLGKNGNYKGGVISGNKQDNNEVIVTKGSLKDQKRSETIVNKFIVISKCKSTK
jgi:hypothetical protein